MSVYLALDSVLPTAHGGQPHLPSCNLPGLGITTPTEHPPPRGCSRAGLGAPWREGGRIQGKRPEDPEASVPNGLYNASFSFWTWRLVKIRHHFTKTSSRELNEVKKISLSRGSHHWYFDGYFYWKEVILLSIFELIYCSYFHGDTQINVIFQMSL